MHTGSEFGATAHALLGLLSIKPMSGYDMRQMVAGSIGHFWSESYGQIYPALKRMAESGLVEKRVETQQGRPDRHVYTLTDAGQKRLAAWLEVPVKKEVVRNELLLKLFFGVHAAEGVNQERMRRFLEAQEKEAHLFAGIAAHLKKEHPRDPNLPYWLITLSRGRHDALASIAWAKETLEVLDGLAAVAGSEVVNAAEREGESA
jgi:PadR family transcriptional regulator AphA